VVFREGGTDVPENEKVAVQPRLAGEMPRTTKFRSSSRFLVVLATLSLCAL
jgi:hypothetical protein